MTSGPRSRRPRRGAAALLSVILLPATAGALAAPKTLAREYDPVVVRTAALSALPTHQTAALRLYRVADGRMAPVPFQFDARDGRGELLIDGPADFVFDDNDELVFMARDTGGRAAAGAAWPAGCGAGLQIEVRDPLDAGRGWVYLLPCAVDTPRATAAPYVTYDRTTNRARSGRYEVEYAPGHNYFTAMRLIDATGAPGPNLLRQTRMRGVPTLSLFFTDVRLEFTEQNSIAVIDGVRNGPVRAVRRVRLSVDLGPLFPELPNGTAYTYHYASVFVTPTRFGVPWLALHTLRDFQFESVVDFAPRALPLEYWDAANPAGVALAGGGGPPVTDADHDWWVQSGATGAMLNAFIIPERWRQWGIARGTAVRPAATDGTGAAAGYSLLHMTRLRAAGDYDLLQAAFVLAHPYHPGDEAAPMAMLRAPLHVSVRPMEAGERVSE